MLVVSDASPINILIRTGDVKVLGDVFGRVLIPPAVRSELTSPGTPTEVREFIERSATWLVVQTPSKPDTGPKKGKGEREALALAVELKADLVLADDPDARKVALRLGLRVAGTIGTLEMAAGLGLLELGPSIALARGAGLIIAETLVEQALERDRLRRGLQ
jgi:predicted nucleic acid-binding protein